MQTEIEANKAVVTRFNKEVMQDGDIACLAWLMSDGFVNRSAAQGTDAGINGLLHAINGVLRPAISGLRVHVHDLFGEGDQVVVRKSVSGIHTGDLFGIPPTQVEVIIDSIEIVKLSGRKYVELWEANNLAPVVEKLRAVWLGRTAGGMQ